MRNSRRIKRMSRNRLKISKMNLTSLMDVFTILVFFLLVNSGSVELVEAPKDVHLPESLEESKPRETVVVAVSPETVMVQGKVVAFTEDILGNEEDSLNLLAERLDELAESVIGSSTMTVAESQEVTILADKAVPFTVVKRVMSTCTARGYERISLAVLQKSPQTTSI